MTLEQILTIVLVPLLIGIIGNLLTTFLARRRDYQRQLGRDAVQLRNVLYFAERQFDDLGVFPEGLAIHELDLNDGKWFGWLDRCDEIRQALFFLLHSLSIGGKMKKEFFKTPINEASVTKHLTSINSYFLRKDLGKTFTTYGLIECTTDAINLLNEAKCKHEEYVKRVAALTEKTPANVVSQERALRDVAKKIECHRLFVEKLAERISSVSWQHLLQPKKSSIQNAGQRHA